MLWAATSGDAEFLFLHVVCDHDVADVEDHFLCIAGLEFDTHFDKFGADGVERVLVSGLEGFHVGAMRG